MTAPNANSLWGRVLAEEFVAAGLTAVCLAPGSRSTPLVIAFSARDDVAVYTHLDERSAAFFALGRAKRTGTPVPVIATSGTATAEFHPAVLEADRGRVPMILLTADRPPELWDSGANQTVDQHGLYGRAVRWHQTLPEPEADPEKLRMLRTSVGRAVVESTDPPPGPVHLNFPFRKPLEPVEVDGDVPADFAEAHPRAARGRADRFVRHVRGRPTLEPDEYDRIATVIDAADRGVVVAGPVDDHHHDPPAIAELARRTGFPLLADPLSGVRFGPHVESTPVCGGYDAYLEAVIDEDGFDPDVVFRFGAAPTSKTLRSFLARLDARTFLVDPGGGWRDPSFTSTDLVTADPTSLVRGLLDRFPSSDHRSSPWLEVEATYWRIVEEADSFFEGAIVGAAIDRAPDPATVFVSNSMPVRDLDRFGRPITADLTVLGNRGASGIDGITSTALGAASPSDDPLVLVTGDLAYFHDMNGLLAIERFGIDVTIVLINNDGGGIFHRLPIEDFEPPFTSQFKTPHGLDFSATGTLYGLDHRRVDSLEGFYGAYDDAIDANGSHLVEVVTDAEASHRQRDRLHDRVRRHLGT